MGEELAGEPGVYCLALRLGRGCEISVGQLGMFRFPEGWYLYVGSALGSGGLKARLGRHMRPKKRHHWHVDHLLDHARIVQVVWAAWPERLECQWAEIARGLAGATIPVPGFGASDCRCPGHLVRLSEETDFLAISGSLATARPGLVVRNWKTVPWVGNSALTHPAGR